MLHGFAIDTSVAIPLLVATHPLNGPVSLWAAGEQLRLCGHALVETYSVLTRLPGPMRVAPSDALRLLDTGFAEPLVLSPSASRVAHRTLAGLGVSGGAAWDGLVALTAREHGAILATRDARAITTYHALGVRVEPLA